MEKFVGGGIDSSEPPVPLVVEPDHGLVDGDLLGLAVGGRLELRFLHPVVDRRAGPFDAKLLENRGSSGKR